MRQPTPLSARPPLDTLRDAFLYCVSWSSMIAVLTCFKRESESGRGRGGGAGGSKHDGGCYVTREVGEEPNVCGVDGGGFGGGNAGRKWKKGKETPVVNAS